MHQGSWQMMPSQCPQAESAVYWLLWLDASWSCTDIGYSCGHGWQPGSRICRLLYYCERSSSFISLAARSTIGSDLSERTLRATLDLQNHERFYSSALPVRSTGKS